MPLVADAGDLRPLQAGTVVLGTYTVSVYYTVSGDAYEVVTTIAPGAEAAGAPIRFVGYLLPGQKAICLDRRVRNDERPGDLGAPARWPSCSWPSG